jgi:hypothetical protein
MDLISGPGSAAAFPPQIIDDCELKKGAEDECRAGPEPDVNTWKKGRMGFSYNNNNNNNKKQKIITIDHRTWCCHSQFQHFSEVRPFM